MHIHPGSVVYVLAKLSLEVYQDQPLYKDSAYTGEDQESVITEYKMKNEVHK